MKIVLVGPRAGKTVELNGRQFVDGVLTLPHETPEQVGGVLLKVLADSHNAHIEGTPAHQAAVEKWEMRKQAAPTPAKEPSIPYTNDEGEEHDLKTLTNAQMMEFAKGKFGKEIKGNRLQLIEQLNSLMKGE